MRALLVLLLAAAVALLPADASLESDVVDIVRKEARRLARAGLAILPAVNEVLPPAGEVLPPADEVLPPAGEVLPPSGEVLPPAGEVLPPAGDTAGAVPIPGADTAGTAGSAGGSGTADTPSLGFPLPSLDPCSPGVILGLPEGLQGALCGALGALGPPIAAVLQSIRQAATNALKEELCRVPS